MRVLHQLGQPRVCFHEILAVPLGMRRGETNALKSVNGVHRLNQLHKGTLAVFHANLPLAVAVDDLSEQRDLLHALLHQPAAFGDNVLDGTAPFTAAGAGDDAKSAVLITALHDADKSSNRSGFTVAQRQVLADGTFAAGLRLGIHNAITPAVEQFVKMLAGAVKFLRAQHEVHIRQLIDQLLPPALRHATHEAKHGAVVALAGLADQRLHLVDGLLLGGIAHTAGVEQDHIRSRLLRGQRIALGHELCGDRLAVTLVHLASVGFDKNARHFRNGGRYVRREKIERAKGTGPFRLASARRLC